MIILYRNTLRKWILDISHNFFHAYKHFTFSYFLCRKDLMDDLANCHNVILHYINYLHLSHIISQEITFQN